MRTHRVVPAGASLTATVWTACLSNDCESERNRPRAIGEESLSLDAPLVSGTNAVRAACSVRIDPPPDAEFTGSIRWSTSRFADDQQLDVAARLTVDGAESVLESTVSDDGSGQIRLLVARSFSSSPCGNSCDLAIELVARTTPDGEIASSTIPAAVHIAVDARSEELDASASVLDVSCDPIEHLTIS